MPPEIEIVEKEGVWHQRAIDRALRALTLGRMDRYLTDYVTTIGHRIYVPRGWSTWPADAREDVLRHERVHVAQFERLGLPLMAIVYLVFPVPVVFAWGRARLEMEAYEETLRVAWERGGRPAAEALREHVVARFTGPDYLWMWPFRRGPLGLDRWFDRTLDRLFRLYSSP